MKKEIKTSTGLIIIFAAAVFFVGGALAYWFYNDPNSYGGSEDTSLVVAKEVIDETADWGTYTNTDYGFSFKYPKEWEATKKEESKEPGMGDLSKDLLYKVTFYNQNSAQKIGCANNEFQNWSDASPTKAECAPILSGLTKEEKDNLTGPRIPENIYVRVYKDDSSLVLKDWLYNTFHKVNSELGKYEVGQEIEMGKEKGYYSSIGCCASSDRNYAIKANGYVVSLGTNYFENSITDTEMPASFLKIAETFKIDDLTADWQTYSDNEFGYSIKYPKAITAKEWIATIKGTPDSEKSNAEMISMIGFGKNFSEFDNDFSVTISLKSLDTEVKLLGYSVPYAKTQDITISGVKGVRATGHGAQEDSSIERDYSVILLPRNDKVYKIYMTSVDQVLFDRAVSSFKFK